MSQSLGWMRMLAMRRAAKRSARMTMDATPQTAVQTMMSVTRVSAMLACIMAMSSAFGNLGILGCVGGGGG